MWHDDRMAAFDFETSGLLPEYALQPWRVKQQKAWATSISLVRHNGEKLAAQGKLFPDRDYLADMLETAIRDKLVMVGWNTVFDIGWLLAYGLDELVFKIKWLDGMLLWRHFFIEPEYEFQTARHKKKSYGLKTAVTEYLPQHAGYEQDVDFHSREMEDLIKLQQYNDQDTVFTWVLAKHFYEQLKPQQLKAALIEADCLPLIAQANLRGMVVDTIAANELRQYQGDIAQTKLEILEPDGVTEKVVRSPLQLSKLIFDDWGLPVLKENTSKKTGKTSRSTDKEVLYELSFQDPRAKLLKEYREALNNRTKFAEAPLKSVEYNEDGRTHPQAIVFGTYSGRLTYGSKQGKGKDERQTGFALHQEKRGKEFRSILIPPPGYTLMEFDASGQEFRWMAIASGDETMLALCAPGEDAHSFMGARIAGWDYEEFKRELANERANRHEEAKDLRQLGKVGNLSLQYRTSAKKLKSVARVQYGLPMELPQAQFIHKTYQQAYPDVPKYWATQIGRTRTLGFVETFAGRRVQVVGNWDGTYGWSMGSTSINYRIQGTGADQKYLALSVLRPYLVRIGGYFGWDLHDGIYMYIPDHMVGRAAVEIKYLLDNLPYEKAWNFKPPINLPWDCKHGKSWGALKEWKYD